MSRADCGICLAPQEIPGDLHPKQVFVPLVCGHFFNWVTGETHTREDMMDKDGLLHETIHNLVLQQADLKRKIMTVLEEG